ncbi:MAG: DUF6992 family protein [Tepidisphaeraceae bacterium]
MQIPDIPVERSADFATAERVRVLRGRQAWVLMGVAIASILVGLGVMQHPPTAPAARAFGLAVAIQFVVWGAIDAAFAGVGVIQSARTARRPLTQTHAAEEAAGLDRLLRALRLNQKLNTLYLLTAAVLLAIAAALASPGWFGHGVGVLLQGGFLFVFDKHYLDAFARAGD